MEMLKKKVTMGLDSVEEDRELVEGDSPPGRIFIGQLTEDQFRKKGKGKTKKLNVKAIHKVHKDCTTITRT